MPTLNLTADEVLTTTRAVRRRLDLTRPVETEVIEECVDIAVQAPTGQNRQRWHFVVVRDPGRRAGLADLYRSGVSRGSTGANALTADDERRQWAAAGSMRRVIDSSRHLFEHLHEVPAMVVPCVEGRPDGAPVLEQARLWGSLLPAVWSFMLAARNRGLGTAWTTGHLPHEKDAAALLGIPYRKVTQAALIPLAYTIGTEFKPAARVGRDEVLHWDTW